MKQFKTIILGTAFLGMIFISCKENKAVEQTPQTPETPATEVAPETAETPQAEIATVLNANLATEEELQGLNLPTEVLSKIMAERPFLTMNDFDKALGEMPNKENLYKSIFVPFNLNTTAEADFKMIPGVGDRMAHEFEEYRPYTSIKQFRKEIGKYVDEDEVARYENYVFVPVELNTASEEDIKALPGVGGRMAHEFEEYRPYKNMEQFRKEIGKYVDDKELSRLERFVYIKE